MNFVRFDTATGRIHGWGHMLPAHVIAERDEKGGILLLDNFDGAEPDGLKVDLDSMSLVPGDVAFAGSPVWSKGDVRLLSQADADAIRDIVLSRQKLWKQDTISPESYATLFDEPGFYEMHDILGHFHDGTLDAVMILKYPHRLGFACEPCAVVSMNMTMGRPGRTKCAAGWDVNNTCLLLAMYDYLAHQGIWRHYNLVGASFNLHHTNPAIPGDEMFERSTVETIPAGKRAVGPDRQFINKFVASRVYAEDTLVRLTVLREDKRPA